MESCLLIARSVTHAQRMVRALESCGIRAGMFRAPTGLSARGCSYAVRIRGEHLSQGRACLARAELNPVAVFQNDANGYREVIT